MSVEETSVIEEVSSSSILTEGKENRIELLQIANEWKIKGNDMFREGKYEDATQFYSKAILSCPQGDDENLAIFFGNRAACYFSMEEYNLTIDDCTHALEKNKDYVKVLYRRSQAYEKLDKIEEALSDIKRVYELDPVSYPKLPTKIKLLEKESQIRLEKLKDEALGKLKDLGNSILGNFGMSLDNFKMQQDPASGSWNISMGNK